MREGTILETICRMEVRVMGSPCPSVPDAHLSSPPLGPLVHPMPQTLGQKRKPQALLTMLTLSPVPVAVREAILQAGPQGCSKSQSQGSSHWRKSQVAARMPPPVQYIPQSCPHSKTVVP